MKVAGSTGNPIMDGNGKKLQKIPTPIVSLLP